MTTDSLTPSIDLAIDRDAAFTDPQGRHKPRLESKQRKLLQKAAPLLEKMLEPGEKIQLITPGCSPYSILEYFTTGWLIVYLKRCLMIVTDRRLLHLPTKSNFDPKMSVAEIRFGDVRELKVSSFLGTKLTAFYRDGSKEVFTAFPGWAGKKLKALLPERAGQGSASVWAERRYLCPRCTEALARDTAECTSCGLAFKDRKRALKYSLLYPGGGYFYTRHPFLGLGDAVVETLFIVFIVVGLIAAFGPEGDLEILAGVGFLVLLLGLEKLITIYHANHFVAERIPVDRNFSPSAPGGPDPRAGNLGSAAGQRWSDQV